MCLEFTVIRHEPGLMVVHKPAGLVTHPSKTGPRSSLVGQLRLFLGPTLRPQLINRLDRETSGIVVVGLDDGAAGELRRIWETRAVAKEYLAIVHGALRQDELVIDAPLGRDGSSAVAIKDKVRSDGAAARTAVRILERFQREEGSFSLVAVRPETGRKHQIRIHLAHAGHPVVGDKLYGGDERYYLDLVAGRLTAAQKEQLLLPCHALHARLVQFVWRGEVRRFTSEPEPWFVAFLPDSARRLMTADECPVERAADTLRRLSENRPDEG